ncbi:MULTISPECIES: hypothetical protein [unclassified Prochlorococcus]|uniref:hypothetical protein n=1 Tax=unclassified Prochlorococcus TaxID=2627481 RepID=UPI0005339736|nr:MULTISPECIES: hypothetical protein [unclassified Prochlorococcus]KGG16142.1 hypothetical protein EV06_0852 [Prochlorococcus sp. MIT 0602]KGG17261.1 hypothetical protein EV07_0699 [Prochlorococcus sp. MIT 0603]
MRIKKDLKESLTLPGALIEASEHKYKAGDHRGAFIDRSKAKQICDCNAQFKALVKNATGIQSKYDLIEDYKRKINDTKKLEIIDKLEKISQSKFNSGDYKGAIKAMRRAEKYF